MGLQLVKGGRNQVTFTKVVVELGWKTLMPLDLDAVAWRLDANDKTPSKVEDCTVYYERKQEPTGSIIHSGDLRGLSKDVQVETIEVDFSLVEAETTQIVFTAHVYEEGKVSKNFGQTKNAYIAVKDDKGTELMRYDLAEDFSTVRGVVFGRFYRKENEGWKFHAVGEGVAECSNHPNGIAALEELYAKK